ncbi:MAG: hypothetical protein H8D23_30240 [Candidatus Brocadiales bacterium]|nr:hypothetical protein [Candidatus Brocadiales bacterium]
MNKITEWIKNNWQADHAGKGKVIGVFFVIFTVMYWIGSDDDKKTKSLATNEEVKAEKHESTPTLDISELKADDPCKNENCTECKKNNGGQVYTGQCMNDMYHGQGTIIFPGGHKYVGQFLNGDMHGYGVFTFSHGEIYEGQMKNGKYHGKGKITKPGGYVKVAIYDEDKIVKVLSLKDKRCSGDCVNGKGTFKYDNGHTYEGNWKNGYFYGKGAYTYNNGDILTVEWKHDQPHGTGNYKTSHGTTINGLFVKGEPLSGITINTNVHVTAVRSILLGKNDPHANEYGLWVCITDELGCETVDKRKLCYKKTKICRKNLRKNKFRSSSNLNHYNEIVKRYIK